MHYLRALENGVLCAYYRVNESKSPPRNLTENSIHNGIKPTVSLPLIREQSTTDRIIIVHGIVQRYKKIR